MHHNAMDEDRKIDNRRVNAEAGIALGFEKVGEKLGFSELVRGGRKRYRSYFALEGIIRILVHDVLEHIHGRQTLPRVIDVANHSYSDELGDATSQRAKSRPYRDRLRLLGVAAPHCVILVSICMPTADVIVVTEALRRV